MLCGVSCLSMICKYYGKNISMDFAVQKSAFNNRLGIQFIYLPPFHLGVHKYQKQQIDTPFYKNCSRLGLRTYDNMLFLRLSWQLHKGKETKSVIDRTTYDDESVRSRDLL